MGVVKPSAGQVNSGQGGEACVRQIVERNRGRISIASQVGQGTTVTVRLPAAEGKAARCD